MLKFQNLQEFSKKQDQFCKENVVLLLLKFQGDLLPWVVMGID